MSTETDAKLAIEKIASNVRAVAADRRFQRMIQLMLESFAPDHVLTELLQNANDVEATNVEITLTNKGVLFTHNGYSFTDANLKALCDVGESTKKPGADIGFMGIGFKATFKVADTVYVFSKPYRFYFHRDEVIVPHWLEEVPPNIGVHSGNCDTSYYLPFRPDLPAEIVESLKKTAFATLEPLCLVFLRNIEKIKVNYDKNTRTMVKTSSKQNENSRHFSIVESVDAKERIFNYLVFRKPFDVDSSIKNDYRARDSGKADLEKTTITVAFSLKDGTVEPVKSVLYTFLPTPFETGLRFAINADFLLNTQRTEVDLVSRWNLWLLENIGAFLKQITEEFAHDDKQKYLFFDILPRKKELPDWLFKKIGEPLIDHIKKTPIVLTSTEEYVLPSQVVLASEAVQKLIPSEKANKEYYAHPKLKGKVFLRDELGIQDIDESASERKFVLSALKDSEWLSSLDQNTVLRIYEYLYDRIYEKGEEQWNLPWTEQYDIERELKNMDLVRTRDGQYFKADKVVLPPLSQNQDVMADLSGIVLTIPDQAVLSTKSSNLFRKLGARDFSQDYAINQILDAQGKEDVTAWTEDEKLRSLRYISKWIELKDYQIPSDYRTKIGNLFLPLEKSGWSRAANCYNPNPELKALLPGSEYVDIEKLKTQVQNVQVFLDVLHVPSIPRVLMIGENSFWSDPPSSISKASFENYRSWLYAQQYWGYSGRDRRVDLYVLDGFDDHIAVQNSRALHKYMDFLFEYWKDYYSSYLVSTLRWFYYTDYTKEVPSYFRFQLNVNKWVPTTKGFAVPGEVFAPLREIKRVAGNLLPYLRISEEAAREKKELLESLGIRTQVSLSLLLHILAIVKNENVTEELKLQLGRIYSRLASLCEDEPVSDDVWILDKKGVFQSARTLYWLDDPETENVFSDDVPAVWVPDCLSRLQLKTLFNALGVKAASTILERSIPILSDKATKDDRLRIELKKRSDYINSLLLHYNAGKKEQFSVFLNQLVVMQENNLKVRLKLLKNVHEIETACFCSLNENKLYVSTNVQMTDVARELSKAFDAPTGSEFAIGFVLTQPIEAVNEQLRRSCIQIVRFDKSLEEPFEQENKNEEAFESTESASPETAGVRETKVSIETSIAESLEAGVDKAKLEVEREQETKEEVNLQDSGKTTVQDAEVQSSKPEVTVDINNDEVAREIEGLQQLLVEGKGAETEKPDVWRNPKEIEEVVSEPKIVVRPFVSASAKKNWHRQDIQGESILVEAELDNDTLASLPPIRPFKEQMKKIVAVMGGNPETVNICVANPATDGDRREGQLFFNVLRSSTSLRWIVVAARELAYLKFPKPSQAHISLMTDLIEKGLKNIKEICPEILENK